MKNITSLSISFNNEYDLLPSTFSKCFGLENLTEFVVSGYHNVKFTVREVFRKCEHLDNYGGYNRIEFKNVSSPIFWPAPIRELREIWRYNKDQICTKIFIFSAVFLFGFICGIFYLQYM